MLRFHWDSEIIAAALCPGAVRLAWLAVQIQESRTCHYVQKLY